LASEEGVEALAVVNVGLAVHEYPSNASEYGFPPGEEFD
jgi:two-component sensor histidine kinase